jgi:AraC-like DNA-binding protein
MAIDFEQTSSYASGGLSVFQLAQSYGVDAQEILKEVGLDAAELSVVGNRIDTDTFCKYLQLTYERCGVPCFGLKASDFIHPTSYHALGLALLSSSTLRSYFRRWERYYSFITTHASMKVQEAGVGASLEYLFFGPAENYPGAARMLREANLALVIKFIRFMYRPDYQPAKVELKEKAASGMSAIYRQYLGDHIEFNAERNAVWVDAVDLDKLLPAANAELARQNDQVVVDFLARMDRANVPARVHAKLIELLPSGDCSKTKVASALFMSVRTLHNKLGNAGVNYQQLLDQTRRELAEQYMKQMNVSISEVAYLLGFSDCSNFSRAFQRWTGSSPSHYRDDIQQQTRAAVEATG